MYIDNQIKRIRITWTEISVHTYERISRSKWRIQLNYACGAEMFLENQPDDLIQCLVLGAFNSGKKIIINDSDIEVSRARMAIADYRELQGLLIE
jgi:hypothetical protein